MSLAGFAGSNLITIILFWIAMAMVVGLGVITLFTIIYHRYIYPKRIYPKYDASFKPACSVILPCKGVPKDFEANIHSFMKLDYDRYEVIFCVESQQDAAVPYIKKLMATDSRAKLVVAGITKSCSQKNFNMLAAIRKATDTSDVYVFADSDIQLYPHWLDELVRPLSDTSITVTSGFRWLYPSRGTLGQIANSYQNFILLVFFSVASFFKDIGLWGGSMAIRRTDFEQLKVKDYWAQTVVDDMSLSRLIMKNSKKTIMVSSCITPTNDALETLRQSTMWFKRQVMFLKAYQRSQWFAALGLVFACLVLLILLPFSVIVSSLTHHSFSSTGGPAGLMFIAGNCCIGMLSPFLGKHPVLFRSILFQPVSLATVVSGILGTVFSNTVKWSGFKYTLQKGKVVSVERM
ncbi:MAG: glycosyltransferase [Chitinivibrionales bacterium]|nr:glycosyltransferase [Chitinivibrionales bacterium]